MEEESQLEFHERWMETAEADVQRATQRWKVWLIAFISMSTAYFTFEFAPGLHRTKVLPLLIDIVYPISMLGMAITASKLGDAKKFLKECRQSLTQEMNKQSLM